MMDRLMSLVPKIYLPNEIYLGKRGVSYFDATKDKEKFFIVSGSIQKEYPVYLEKIGVNKNNSYICAGEPNINELKKVQKSAGKKSHEIIVGIGGGSVIDLAKFVKVELGNQMIAMPTTIGSGAEVSQHALYNDSKTKVVKSGSKFMPDVVILDPTFLYSLDKNMIFYQSIDAFAHAIEALVSRMSNPFSDMLALAALDELYEGLNTYDEESSTREKLQYAGILAGIAQSSASTGIAHSLAHCIGAEFKIPHSKAVSMFLIDSINLNKVKTDKYRKLSRSRNFTDKTIVKKLEQLYQLYDIRSEKLPLMLPEDIALRVQSDVCTFSNPFKPEIAELVAILRSKI